MARKSYEWCQKCHKLYELSERCEHLLRPHVSPNIDAPAFHAFAHYVDEHISLDGRPVLITDASQKRALMRSQWRGDFNERLVERDWSEMRKRAIARRERLNDQRKEK